jgi:hypothetical protein
MSNDWERNGCRFFQRPFTRNSTTETEKCHGKSVSLSSPAVETRTEIATQYTNQALCGSSNVHSEEINTTCHTTREI